jgi:hypothetical protein
MTRYKSTLLPAPLNRPGLGSVCTPELYPYRFLTLPHARSSGRGTRSPEPRLDTTLAARTSPAITIPPCTSAVGRPNRFRASAKPGC